MNNEFNNQNMNQFENNNMNSDYSNNYNSLNNQNNSKGNNGLVVVLIIIIIALVGLCLFFALDKKDTDVGNNKDNVQEENKDENNKDNDIQQNDNNNLENTNNKEINLKSIECIEENNKCTKVFNMNYNGMEHEIKIVQSIEGENVGVPYSYNKSIKIYIDGNIIDTIENISSGTNNTNFDGYAYVFDSKYLGILYPGNHADYVLNVYNDNKKIGEQKIIWGLQGIYKDESRKEALNTLEKIEFNGNKLLFWGDSCYVPLTVGDKFIKTSLTIKNNKINMEAVDLLDKLYGSGATC